MIVEERPLFQECQTRLGVDKDLHRIDKDNEAHEDDGHDKASIRKVRDCLTVRDILRVTFWHTAVYAYL